MYFLPTTSKKKNIYSWINLFSKLVAHKVKSQFKIKCFIEILDIVLGRQKAYLQIVIE